MDNESNAGGAVVPYIRDVTEPIERILVSHNVKVAQKRFQAREHIFSQPRDRRTEGAKDRS